MKLLACQTASQGILTADARSQNLRRIFQQIRKHVETQGRTDLVVLPELSTIEYSEDSFQQLATLAEPLRGPSFNMASALAKDLGSFVAYGFPRVEADRYYLSQAVVSPQGEYVTHYDKVHIAQFGASAEKGFFSRGQRLGVFSVAEFKVGIIICYDFRFAEYVRYLIQQHAVDVILHPSAFTRDATFASWHPFVLTRALENQVYYLSVNRAGKDWGHSIFCPPWVDEQNQPTVLDEREQWVSFELSKQVVQKSRDTYPFRQDALSRYDNLEA